MKNCGCTKHVSKVTTCGLLSGDTYLHFYWKSHCYPLPPGTMQFSGRGRRLNTNSQTELYGHALQFYGQPPLENISLAEFETFAVDRLKCKTLVLSHQSNEFYLIKFAVNAAFVKNKKSDSWPQNVKYAFSAGCSAVCPSKLFWLLCLEDMSSRDFCLFSYIMELDCTLLCYGTESIDKMHLKTQCLFFHKS